MGTATATATALDDDDDDDDEDLSSLGDASPIQDLEVHEQQRHTQKQRARLRSGTISFVCIYFLVYMSLSSAPPLLMTDDSNYGLNRTVVFQTRIHHTQQVASTMARVYKPTPPSVWCIDGRLKMEQSKRRPMGLSYLKIPRAASTTAGGINRRIARNFAKRQGLESCIRHDGHVPGMYYYKRDELSYLWTLVRDPAQRAMSRVAKTFSKDPLMTTDTSINANYSISVLQQLKTSKDVQFGAISMGRGGFQLQYTMLSIIDEWSAWNASDPTQVVNPRQVQRHVEQVINGYDFIGYVFLMKTME